MSYKKLFTPTGVIALLTLALAFVMVQLLGTPLQDLLNGLFVLAIYGLLIASYMLRIALVYFGVFVVYRILRKRVNGQGYKQAEV